MTVSDLIKELTKIPNQNAEVKILTGNICVPIEEVADYKGIVILEGKE